ncbi:invasin [Edwardsiella piscicida]|nr:invasin [Edwardsiella piscicida]
MKQTIGLLAALFTFGTLNSQAEGNVELTLRMVPNLSSQVWDGQKISGGEIRTHNAHSGYQVWLDAPQLMGAPNRYVISGKSGAQHKLRVILVQNGWEPDKKTGHGVIKLTGEAQAYFDIIADGNQTIPADSYPITMWGCYLEP